MFTLGELFTYHSLQIQRLHHFIAESDQQVQKLSVVLYLRYMLTFHGTETEAGNRGYNDSATV